MPWGDDEALKAAASVGAARLLAATGLRTGQLDGRATRLIAESKLRPPFDDPSMSLGSGTGAAASVETYLKDPPSSSALAIGAIACRRRR